MGSEACKLCNCISFPGSPDDNDTYIYVLQNTDLSEYYSSNISIEEKEELLLKELKKLRKMKNSTRHRSRSRSRSSKNSTQHINNHPYISSKADTILSSNAALPPKKYNTNGTSHQNIGEISSISRANTTPLASTSIRVSISPEMDDGIWKLLTENPGAMFTPTTEKYIAMPSSKHSIVYSASARKFSLEVPSSPVFPDKIGAIDIANTSDPRFNTTRREVKFVGKNSVSEVVFFVANNIRKIFRKM